MKHRNIVFILAGLLFSISAYSTCPSASNCPTPPSGAGTQDNPTTTTVDPDGQSTTGNLTGPPISVRPPVAK